MAIQFRASAGPTLGVEWELGLVDRRTGALVSAAGDVVEEARAAPEFTGRVHDELLRNTVELVTGVCRSVPEAVEDLRATRDHVLDILGRHDLELFGAGMHPFARGADQTVTEGPRYAALMERTRWWGRQMVIFGVHVHVGITSAHKVLPVLNGLLRWFPHLQALSASSPFWNGEDTGYASNRSLVFQQLPTAGLPFQFDVWSQFESYVDDLLTTGVVHELKEVRWDVRPAPHLGTVEVRICDSLPTLEEVAAVTALTHCLVVDLDRRLDEGIEVVRLPPWHVQENKWRSARYGLDMDVIVDAGNKQRSLREDLLDELDRLTPVARRLGCERELASIEGLLAHGVSYERQRALVRQNGGDLRAVPSALARELRTGLG